MFLKSDKVKSAFNNLNCGICWYLTNSSCHFASFIGGNVPVTTFHSVIDNPEPVRRVMPPIITIVKTKKHPLYSQRIKGRLLFNVELLIIRL